MDSTSRALLVALGVLLVVALGFSALMGGGMGPGMMGQGPAGPTVMPGRGWMWGFGGLVMLTFWGALIVGIVLLVRSMGVGGGPLSHSTPLDTLKRRFVGHPLQHGLLFLCFLDWPDDGDRLTTLGQNDFLAGAHGLDGLREVLVGFAQPKPHVVMLLHCGPELGFG